MEHARHTPGATVQLQASDASWPQQYDELVAQLTPLLPAPLRVFEHIGSTAVPGLCAKPVLDVLWGLPDLGDVPAHRVALEAAGFQYRPAYEAELPERRYFVRPEGPGLRVHLHGVLQGGPLWRSHLAFRGALRANAALAQAYAELKQALALQHARDKAAYTAAKAPFIRRVLACCGG